MSTTGGGTGRFSGRWGDGIWRERPLDRFRTQRRALMMGGDVG